MTGSQAEKNVSKTRRPQRRSCCELGEILAFVTIVRADYGDPSSGRPQWSCGVKRADRVGVASHHLPRTVFASVRGCDAELERLDLLAVAEAGRPSLDLEHGNEVV